MKIAQTKKTVAIKKLTFELSTNKDGDELQGSFNKGPLEEMLELKLETVITNKTR